jgi:uncharacterized phage protein gp47/JayE
MALDDLPGTLETPPRGEIETKFRRDYGIVSPESDTTDGTQPDVLAKTVAVTLLPVYSDCVLVAGGINEDEATGARLDRVGARYGVPRPQAVGASGYVYVTAATSGGTIQTDDEIKERQTKKKYRAAETKTLGDGAPIRIAGIDTGPATNLPEGTTLQWSSPRTGIGQTATVAAGGLTGGADVADDAAYRAVIQEARRNPPNADNDAAIQRAVMSTPGLAIASVFSYPGVFGPGTYAFAFLLATPAGSNPTLRIPNAAQRAAVLAWVTAQMPGDDSYFCLSVSGLAASFALRVAWDPGSPGWLDSVPWPAYAEFSLPPGTAGATKVNSSASPTQTTVGTDNGDYTGYVQPQVGQSIAIWDKNALLFRRKLIVGVSGSGPFVLTFEPTGVGGSDIITSPSNGDRVMPWSDSLGDLVKPVLEYFNGLGPGEMFANFSSDGRRQRRNPAPPKKYPQVVSTNAIVPILAVPSVQSGAIAEGTDPLSAGTPGISVNLRTLRQIAVFPF